MQDDRKPAAVDAIVNDNDNNDGGRGSGVVVLPLHDNNNNESAPPTLTNKSDDDDDDDNNDDNDNDDDDDDEDDWSRLVETDEHTHGHDVDGSFRMESVVEQSIDHHRLRNNNSNDDNNDDHGGLLLSDRDDVDDQNSFLATPMLRPTQRALSMKEKLVLRERERRIETERARLKRQFALSNNAQIEQEEAQAQAQAQADHLGRIHIQQGGGGQAERARVLAEAGGAAGSVATLGEESTMVHPDEEESLAHSTLPVTMERFLRNSDLFNLPMQTATDTDDQDPTAHSGSIAMANGNNAADGSGAAAGGLLMERLIQDLLRHNANPGSLDHEIALMIDRHSSAEDLTSSSNVQQSVSLDVDRASQNRTHPAGSSSLITGTGNLSMEANNTVDDDDDDDDDVDDDEQELEGRQHVLDLVDETLESSDDTPLALHATAAAAEPEEPRVLRLTEEDMKEMAATDEESIANYPPSERDDNLSEVGELLDFASPIMPRGGGDVLSQYTASTTAVESASLGPGSETNKPPSAVTVSVSSDQHSEDDAAASANDTVAAQPPSECDFLSPVMDTSDIQQLRVPDEMKVGSPPRPAVKSDSGNVEPDISNRRLRPGMAVMPTAPLSVATAKGVPRSPGEVRRMNEAMVVEGFDFDKDAPKSPHAAPDMDMNMNDSYRDLPDDKPLLFLPVQSPTRPHGGGGTDYGAMEEGGPGPGPGSGSGTLRTDRGIHHPAGIGAGETEPLLCDVPPEIITRREGSNGTGGASSILEPVNQLIQSRFSCIFSQEREEQREIQNESKIYLDSSVFRRAAPERLFGLTITLILEIPVLLVISGGSNALCELIGRQRYQLLVAFIPLTSAISGNAGLQASTLTTRAISHNHVTAMGFSTWFAKEIGAAGYLGLGMGLLLGLTAYAASNLDFPFALTIMIAQFVSILMAGCTGTIAPLLSSFMFKQDAGKWSGPLETAIQDIVGSLAMVILSYHLLAWFGSGPIDDNDVCGATNKIEES